MGRWEASVREGLAAPWGPPPSAGWRCGGDPVCTHTWLLRKAFLVIGGWSVGPEHRPEHQQEAQRDEAAGETGRGV